MTVARVIRGRRGPILGIEGARKLAVPDLSTTVDCGLVGHMVVVLRKTHDRAYSANNGVAMRVSDYRGLAEMLADKAAEMVESGEFDGIVERGLGTKPEFWAEVSDSISTCSHYVTVDCELEEWEPFRIRISDHHGGKRNDWTVLMDHFVEEVYESGEFDHLNVDWDWAVCELRNLIEEAFRDAVVGAAGVHVA
ncbi:MAG: hypothetical protein D6800_07375 [Candidatus Zixiibacteriota bacterium]|nr:MAG: hypothetical protein D6800_07375 [candidate division Zixibacteria bacterium]